MITDSPRTCPDCQDAGWRVWCQRHAEKLAPRSVGLPQVIKSLVKVGLTDEDRLKLAYAYIRERHGQ